MSPGRVCVRRMQINLNSGPPLLSADGVGLCSTCAKQAILGTGLVYFRRASSAPCMPGACCLACKERRVKLTLPI
jgi:hypothetical protein